MGWFCTTSFGAMPSRWGAWRAFLHSSSSSSSSLHLAPSLTPWWSLFLPLSVFHRTHTLTHTAFVIRLTQTNMRTRLQIGCRCAHQLHVVSYCYMCLCIKMGHKSACACLVHAAQICCSKPAWTLNFGSFVATHWHIQAPLPAGPRRRSPPLQHLSSSPQRQNSFKFPLPLKPTLLWEF